MTKKNRGNKKKKRQQQHKNKRKRKRRNNINNIIIIRGLEYETSTDQKKPIIARGLENPPGQSEKNTVDYINTKTKI